MNGFLLLFKMPRRFIYTITNPELSTEYFLWNIFLFVILVYFQGLEHRVNHSSKIVRVDSCC